MIKTSHALLAAAMLLAPTRAIASDLELGNWFAPRPVGPTENTANGWGAAKGSGWNALPLASINISSSAHPLCLAGTGDNAWIGLASALTTGTGVRLHCSYYQGSQEGGTVFQLKSDRPAPLWMGANASTPEPRGTVILATQPNGRRLMACQVALPSSDPFVGYIGDDGKCYGKALSGKTTQASTYLVLVKKGTGTDAQPAYGWIPSGRGSSPHGTLASTPAPDSNSLWTLSIQSCRVRENNINWPGWVRLDGLCKYYTYINGQVASKTASRFERYRVAPGAPKSPHVFSKVNNQNVYACTSYVKLGNGIRKFMAGFTTNPTACVDGTQSTTQDYVLGKTHYKWNTPTLLALNPEAQKG